VRNAWSKVFTPSLGSASFKDERLCVATIGMHFGWREMEQEVDRANGHADAEDNPGQHALRLTLAIGEHQSANDDGKPMLTESGFAGRAPSERSKSIRPRTVL
jgi:hypothetical protein